jgi:hypothetical protein
MIDRAAAIAATSAVEHWYLSGGDRVDPALAMCQMIGAETRRGHQARCWGVRWPKSRTWHPLPDPLVEIADAAEIARRVDPAMMIPLCPREASLCICYRALALAMPDQSFGTHWPDLAWTFAGLAASARPYLRDHPDIQNRISAAMARMPANGE